MDIERGIVEILFRYIPYSNVSIHDNFAPQNHDCMVVNKNAFLEQCRRVFPERSEDEWINAYLLTKENMSKNGGRPSVFTLISQLCEKLLVCHSSDVLCKFEQLFRWREISLSLGQDMLICCYLADYDLRHNIKRRNFSWLPVVMSDNQRIRAIFEKGIAENHFHLKGSARIFEINWICIMNNICGQEKNFKAIKKSLSCSSDGNKNFSTSFYDDCKLAALYRLYLFCELKGIKSQDLFNLIEEGSKLLGVYIKDVQDKIDYIKLLYGVQGKGGKTFDYALSKEVLIYSERKYDILLGERYFLYQCYRACFRNDFSRKTQNIFYQYLKLQVSFRNEMIQVNKNVGFKNFSDYEKRKTCFLDSHSKYFSEYIRSAIKYQADRKCLKSLEMRLTPATISNDIFKMLKKYDNIISEIQNDEKKNAIKYVMHFPKRPDVLSKLTFIGDKCTQPSVEYNENSAKFQEHLNCLLHCENIRLICGGAENVDSKDGFDVVIMLTVLYWHYKSELGKTLLKNINGLCNRIMIWESGDEIEEEKEFIRKNSDFKYYIKIANTVGTGKVRELGVWWKSDKDIENFMVRSK